MHLLIYLLLQMSLLAGLSQVKGSNPELNPGLSHGDGD